MRRRMRQRGHQAEDPTDRTLAHRHPHRRLPPVDLRQLPREIRRPLIALRVHEEGTHLGQILLQNGDPTPIALPTQTLQDDRGRHLGILVQHPEDRPPVGIELRSPPPTPRGRRLLQPNQPRHRVAAHPQLLGDIGLRPALPEEQPMHLRPILHPIHPFLLESDQDPRLVANRSGS